MSRLQLLDRTPSRLVEAVGWLAMAAAAGVYVAHMQNIVGVVEWAAGGVLLGLAAALAAIQERVG